MKYIACEQPGQFAMRETEIPEPKRGEALVKIKRVGICGTDLHAYEGTQPFFSYPRILGHELSGEIIRFEGHAAGFSAGTGTSIFSLITPGSSAALRPSISQSRTGTKCFK